jgi:hypothetical protein
MSTDRHIFMLKYGSQKQREGAVYDAIHAIKTDPTMDDAKVESIGNRLWHHMDEHGDNPELHKFMIHLGNMHDELDHDE